jgi:phosphatidylglycerol:prolipoprotein diacylglycerol transferase
LVPELFRIGSFSVSPFGPALAAAFLLAFAQLRWGMRRLGAGDDEDASSLLVAAGLFGILGGKVYYAILYGDWRLLFDRAGLVWYGGFLAGAAAVLWVAWRRRLPFWPTLDAATPGLALGYAVGRIGCFLVGDDYGRPTDLPWGLAFPEGLPPTTAGYLRSEFGVQLPASIPDSQLLTVHPTQLYETAIALLIWGIGILLLKRNLRRGTPALVVLALLALERFGVEFLRAKDDRFLGPLTLAQAISLGLLVLLAITAVVRARQPVGAEVPAGPASPRRGERGRR